jgi:hypothetical protein
MPRHARPRVPPCPPYRYWTRAEEKLVRSLDAQAAARATGRSVQAVRRKRSKLGLPTQKNWSKWTDAEDRLVLLLTPIEAANRLPHRNNYTIYRRRLMLWKGKPTTRKKRKKAYRRLSRAVEKFIRKRFGKIPTSELALQLGLSRQTIYNVVRGKASTNGKPLA